MARGVCSRAVFPHIDPRNMERGKLVVEYELATRSPSIIWNMIGTAAGLQKWMADDVQEENGEMTFTWGNTWAQHDTRTAKVVAVDKLRRIRLKWDYIEADYAYWEMRIEKSEITGMCHLVITDFAEADDVDDLRSLWADNLDRLHQVSGL